MRSWGAGGLVLACAVALGVGVIARAEPPSRPLSPAAALARRSVTFLGRAMGTYTHVVIVAADSATVAPAAAAALGEFRRIDSLMTNWTETSEVARLNREAARGPTEVQAEVARVLATSLEVWRQSDGTNDITVEPLVRAWGFLGGTPHVPSDEEAQAAFRRVGARQLAFDAKAGTLRYENAGVRIDLGGIAKGYAVDTVADTLRARGITDALVDISGNMRALGTPAGAEGWRIGIRDPRDRMPFFARVLLHDDAISTSGKYEQFVAANGKTYGHIMDPRTGRPADGLISVTVVSRSAMTCDAWDTPLFVLGPAAARNKAKERDDFAAVIVVPGEGGVDTVWVESVLRPRFVLEAAAAAHFRVVYY
jgi:thiamine biosynthesis lipoprotein